MSETRRRAFLSLARRVGLLLGAVAFPAADLRPQGEPGAEGLARYLPADAVLVFSLPDLAGTLQDCRSLPLWQMAREKEVSDFLAQPLKQMHEWIEVGRKSSAQASGIDFGPLLETKFRGIEVGIARLRFPETGGPPEFAVAARVDAGADFPKVKAILDRLREKVPPEKAVVRDESVGGKSFTVIRPKPGADSPAAAVFWSAEGTAVHLAMGTPGSSFPEEFLGRVAGGTASPSLASDPEFRACTSRVGNAGSEMRLFVRVAPILDAGIKGLSLAPAGKLPAFLQPQGLRAALSALGLDGLRALAWSSTAAGDHSVNESYVLAPSPRKGLLALGGEGAADLALLERVPKEADSFSVGCVKMGELWDTLFRALGALSAETEQKVAGELARFEEKNGVNLRKDLLGSIGETYLMYSLPAKNMMMGGPPDVTLMMPLRDAAAFDKAARALSDALVGTGMVALKEADLEGTKVRSFSVKMDGGGSQGPFGGMPFNPFVAINPAYAVKGDLLIASLSRQGLQKAVRRLAQTGGEGGASVEGYRRFAGKLPKGASGVAYSDPRETVGLVYTTVTSFLPLAAAGRDLPFDLNSLPPAEAIKKHLFGGLSYSKSDKDGLYSCSFSPWGVDTLLGVGVVCAATGSSFVSYQEKKGGSQEEVVVAPAGKEDPVERARREMLDIKSGLTIHRMDHDGLPASLAELLKPSAEYPDGLLLGRKEVPKDPWGNEYLYEPSADRKTYKLRSKGPNGADEGGGGDDVVGK